MQIVSGFSDLKRQFRLKSASDKSFADLRFHFTVENQFLAMHDFRSKYHWMVFSRRNTGMDIGIFHHHSFRIDLKPSSDTKA
jgi:hypothetical protein